ncbi:hypothetical protein [Halomarina litorea]|uniref:hypothetical protein n=1 Tax=Halomarina litorea TaxID=2961595 RepID=UPI0020C3EADB|nr:hypothetical protein [Halomarina sp. BCD28]
MGQFVDRAARYQRGLSRLLQVAIAAMLVAGLLTLNVGVVVNATAALAVTFLPAVLARDDSLRLDPKLTLWVTLAVFLHTLGMFGGYEHVWWWDHVTHTLSATVVAAVGYATARALDEYSDAIRFTGGFLFAFTLLFTIALGVLWEVVEFSMRELGHLFDLEPVLVQYGLEDTVVDLVFDIVGAILVATFGTRELSDLANRLTERFERDRDTRVK